MSNKTAAALLGATLWLGTGTTPEPVSEPADSFYERVTRPLSDAMDEVADAASQALDNAGDAMEALLDG